MSGVAPERGAIWVTPHGVRMLMPKKDAAKPYIRLDYTLAGKRTQRTAGRAENWQEAWSIASGIDDEIAAELAGADGEPIALTVGMLAEKWVVLTDDQERVRGGGIRRMRVESAMRGARGHRGRPVPRR
jgi:hypothetical protein